MTALLPDLTNYHFVGLGVVLLAIASYFYWVDLRGVFASRFRAYDMLILTAVIAVIVGRVAVVIEDKTIYLGENSEWWRLLQISDFNLDYLTLLYVPLLAYQFFSFNIVANREWQRHARLFLRYGVIFTLLAVGIQLLRAWYFDWGGNYLVYHLIQAGWLIGNLGQEVFGRGNVMWSKVSTPASMLLVSIGMMASLAIYPDKAASDTTMILITQIILCLTVLIPFGSSSRPEVSTNVRGVSGFYK